MSFTADVAAETARRLASGTAKPGAYTPAALLGATLVEACGAEYLISDQASTSRTL